MFRFRDYFQQILCCEKPSVHTSTFARSSYWNSDTGRSPAVQVYYWNISQPPLHSYNLSASHPPPGQPLSGHPLSTKVGIDQISSLISIFRLEVHWWVMIVWPKGKTWNPLVSQSDLLVLAGQWKLELVNKTIYLGVISPWWKRNLNDLWRQLWNDLWCLGYCLVKVDIVPL